MVGELAECLRHRILNRVAVGLGTDEGHLQDRQRPTPGKAVASSRLADRRRRVCCVAGILSVWLNLLLAVLMPLAHGVAPDPTLAGAVSATSIALSSKATPICTRDGVRWIDADGNQAPAPPQHSCGLCPFCLPLTGGGITPPSEAVLALVAREAGPADYHLDRDEPAAVRTGNPSARPRAPPASDRLSA